MLRMGMLTSIAVCLVACATTQPPAPPQDVSAEIQVANDGFAAVFMQGDAAAVAGLYTPDAQLLPPNADFVTGGAAIEAFWRAVMDAGVASARLETVEALRVDSLAFEVGRYALADASEAPIDEGKYVVVWRLTPDGWRLHRDIWNSDRPLTP